ncbi:MAG: hypothetical protein AB7F75_08930 [Planctomycetota bacterium]
MIRMALAVSLAMGLLADQAPSHRLEARILTPTHVIPSGLVAEVEGAVNQIPGQPLVVNLDSTIPAVVCLKFGQSLLLEANTRHHNPYSIDAPTPFDAGLMRPGSTVAITPTEQGTFRIFDSLQGHSGITVVVAERDTAIGHVDNEGRLILEDLPPGTNCINLRTVLGRPLFGQKTLVLPVDSHVEFTFP